MNIIETKETIETKANDKSTQYWRAQAKKILAAHPEVTLVEIVRTGRKTDANNISRGDRNSNPLTAVVVASTGGKWGKSRREFYPAK